MKKQEYLITAGTYFVSRAMGACPGQALSSAAITFGTALAMYEVGHGALDFTHQGIGNIVGHGLVSGLASVASHQSFRSGFISGAVAGALDPACETLGYAGVIPKALVGGTLSEMNGGKFASGAETAAIGYLFNQMANDSTKPDPKTSGRSLCTNELAAARAEYGDNWTPEDARIVDAKYLPLQRGAMTPDGNIIYWPGSSQCSDMTQCSVSGYKPGGTTDTFIHEMGHVYEAQNGVWVKFFGVVEQFTRLFGMDPYIYKGSAAGPMPDDVGVESFSQYHGHHYCLMIGQCK